MSFLLIVITALATVFFGIMAHSRWDARCVAKMRGEYYTANWYTSHVIVFMLTSIFFASLAVAHAWIAFN